MTLVLRSFYRNRCNLYSISQISQPVKWSSRKNCPIRILASGVCYQSNFIYRPLVQGNNLGCLVKPVRQCSSQSNDLGKTPLGPEPKKPGLIQRFKQMYRDYWYVLLPVHMTTSAMWFGSFYYIVRSGVDVISLLESIGIAEKLLVPLRESGAGYFALAFALYKLVTPLRYAVTVGGTTYAIKRLTAIGWIKPVPSRERIKEMLQEKKDNLQDRFYESKQHYQTQIKEKHTQVMDEMRRYKTEIRNIKDKVKKM